MKRYLLWILLPGLLCFIGGLGWGIWSKNKQAQELAHSVPLRVLCAENWLSNETLEKFSKQHNVRIQQWTYKSPSEFLRQMANADGNVDVICTSSLLLKSLVRSRWIKKSDYQSLSNMKLIAVDFSHLPFDQKGEYSVPVFWNLFGFFGKEEPSQALTWKQIWASKKISLWGEELNVLELMNRLGLNVEQRLTEEEDSKAGKALDEEIKRFTKNTVHFIKPGLQPLDPSQILDKADWVEVPLARVASALATSDTYKFWLPQDGATVEVGVLAIGEKSQQSTLAMELINELLSNEEALALHSRVNAGVVHASLGNMSAIPALQKAEALRKFPLNRLQFPELNVEALPRFQKIYDEAIAVE
jgi:spermidine/putrescine-binding protein